MSKTEESKKEWVARVEDFLEEGKTISDNIRDSGVDAFICVAAIDQEYSKKGVNALTGSLGGDLTTICRLLVGCVEGHPGGLESLTKMLDRAYKRRDRKE